MELEDLEPCQSYWYLATPYSKYFGGPEAAFEEACRVAGRFILAGVPVYSPIVQTHPIALHAAMDPLDHKIWLPADRPLMDAAHGLIVIMMDGWGQSYGIGEEIKVFVAAGKPVLYCAHPVELK